MELRRENVRLFGTTAGRVSLLLAEAFPPASQEPFPLLVALAKRQGIDFWALYDNETFCGFTYGITRGDVTYVLYLAVASEHRSKGYGAAILDEVKRAYPGNAVVLDIESPTEPADNSEQRVKRQAFYFRNGFRELGLHMCNHGEVYDLLVCGRDVSAEEITSLLSWFSFGVFTPDLV